MTTAMERAARGAATDDEATDDAAGQPGPEAAALTETAGVRRTDDAIVRVMGEDARSWLNGQITNDVATPEPGAAVYALVVSLKGKIMADLWALDRGATEATDTTDAGDELWLMVPGAVADELARYLDGFVIMEDVEIERLEHVVLSVQGPKAPEVVEAAGDLGGTVWPCDRLGTGGRDVVVPREHADEAHGALVREAEARGGRAVGDAGYDLARVRRGVGRYGIDFGDWTLPQEAGLRESALSFGKGCYQGQEAVVMLEHRGKPPKKLLQLELEASAPPPPDTQLETSEGRRAGRITSAVADPDRPGHVLALGYLKRDFACEGTRVRAGDTEAVVRKVLGG